MRKKIAISHAYTQVTDAARNRPLIQVWRFAEHIRDVGLRDRNYVIRILL